MIEFCVYMFHSGFRKVVKKHDKLTSVPLSLLESQKLRSFFVQAQGDLEQVLVELSDVYKFIKENSEEETTGEHKVSDVRL